MTVQTLFKTMGTSGVKDVVASDSHSAVGRNGSELRSAGRAPRRDRISRFAFATPRVRSV
jgi:hypothetical protein